MNTDTGIAAVVSDVVDFTLDDAMETVTDLLWYISDLDEDPAAVGNSVVSSPAGREIVRVAVARLDAERATSGRGPSSVAAQEDDDDESGD